MAKCVFFVFIIFQLSKGSPNECEGVNGECLEKRHPILALKIKLTKDLPLEKALLAIKLLNSDEKGDCSIEEVDCGENRELVNCSTRCDGTCYDRRPHVCNTTCTDKTCVCIAGYVLDPNSNCVKLEDCKTRIPCPNPNEEFNICLDKCRPKCAPLNSSTEVIPPGCINSSSIKEPCLGGCDCKEGFLRNDSNICVLPENCAGPCDDVNAVRKPCGDPCPLTCANLNNPPKFCPAICHVNGCACKSGYVKNATGQCVLPEECPPLPCDDVNAVRKPCGDPCPLTCANLNNPPKFCPAICHVNGCACKSGYVKNATGQCILPEECPLLPCDDVNAVRKPCGDPCPLTCANLDNPPKACQDKCLINGCACKDGYVKDSNGKCVDALSCPCDDGKAVRRQCANPCPLTCDLLDTPLIPWCPKTCMQYGCDCKEGFVKNNKGKCIGVLECPCNDVNAVRKPCGDPCPLTCATLDSTVKPICPNTCLKNECACKEGFVRDDNGNCIKALDCPCSDPNKERKPCGDSCSATCDNMGIEPMPCFKNQCNKNGCTCKGGLVQNNQGDCVEPLSCPCKGVHEKRVACFGCLPTCDNRDSLNNTNAVLPCPVRCTFHGQCVCEDGYLRNRNGVCVLIRDCPPLPCDDVNKIRVPCNTNDCGTKCEDLNNFGILKCTRQSSCLYDKCVCKPPYYEDSNGRCVADRQCKCRKPNTSMMCVKCIVYCEETFLPEVMAFCPVLCNQNACICNKGYKLRKDGICVLPSQC